MKEAGQASADFASVVEDSPANRQAEKRERHVIRSFIAINALLLIAVACWLYIDRDATTRSLHYLNNVHWWSFSWGQYVPDMANKAEAVASKRAMLVGSFFACFCLALGITAVFLSRGRERVALPPVAIILALGWIATGTKWDYIRLRGQSAELAQFAGPVRELAQELDGFWPKQSGEITSFGAFLAYPYGTPRTLIMLGDPNIPGTSLRIAAIERTPGEAIRFQLSGDAPKVWLEWRTVETPPSAFQGGLQQIITPVEYHEIASDLFVVKYLIDGSENSGQ